MSEWTFGWPTEEGLYWFYGWRFGYDERLPELSFVEVRSLRNSRGGWSCVGITRGHFLYKAQADGVWQRADVPIAPNNHQMEEIFGGETTCTVTK